MIASRAQARAPGWGTAARITGPSADVAAE
jgi:hypothetical protein